MADSKISALPAATLPLAGTEVLPIVQGGITEKVAVDNLTVRNIRANATTGILQVTGPAAATTRVVTVPNADFTAARTDAAQSFTGDQTLSTGNLVMGTSGKGVSDSTGVTLLSFTTQRVESNKPIQATSVSTTSGNTASTATATPVTLFAVSGDSVWIVNAAVTGTGAPAAYTAVAIVKSSGGVATATAIAAATNLTITVSGLNVQATQVSGVAQIMAYSAVRLF